MKRIGLITIFWITCISLLFAQGNGTKHYLNLSVDGQKRYYTLYVPEGYNSSEAWPLVFNFHWLNGSASVQEKISEMYLVADTAKFLIVYPQGMPVYFWPYEGTWNGWNVPDLCVATQDDVSFVSKIIDDIIKNPSFNIDLSRIHAAGISSGGHFSFYLAFKLSNRIASVASVAAPMTDTLINYICSPVRKISVLHMQGTNDQDLPVNGNPEWGALPLKEVSDYWAGVNGCNAIADSTQLEDIDLTDNSTVTLFDYNGCDQETEVKLYRINGGGHTWPGGWIDPAWIPNVGVLNKDINASAEIWNFFKRNPHPNPWVEIPDTAFLNALIYESVDTNGDSIISYAEAEAIIDLDVCYGNISDITGIEAFINLETLKCGGNQLTSLDVSACTKLEFLLCGMPSQTFPISNLFTSLDLSNNTALTYLHARALPLTSLDLSNNTALTEVILTWSVLTSLNVSGLSALKRLHCWDNHLTSLDVSECTALEELNIGGMPNLFDVCVWEGFNPDNVDITTAESPNVNFTTECSITGFNEYKENSTIDIYPNPSDGIINIEIGNPNNATIEIYNVTGKLVFSKEIDSKVEKIDVSGLSAGIYIVKVMQNSTVYYGKVMVR